MTSTDRTTRWRSWLVAGHAVAGAMRLVPRRRRFRVALAVARALEPVIARTTMFREQSGRRVDGVREISLHSVLDHLSRHGTTFALDLDRAGAERVAAALPSPRGVLIVSPHTSLSRVFIRVLRDMGADATFVGRSPTLPILGTGDSVPTLQPSPRFLLAVRSRLRAGGVVSAMLDGVSRNRASECVTVPTARGPMYVSPALIHVAVRCGARIFFLATRVDGERIIPEIAEPAPSSAGDADAVTRDFIAFLQRHVARIDAR